MKTVVEKFLLHNVKQMFLNFCSQTFILAYIPLPLSSYYAKEY